MHILMADDDKDDYYILQEAAEKAGLSPDITYASNWLELWRQLMKALPDVIFLDINMPVKDGIECLQLLREDPKFMHVPVIMYTTSTSRTDIDKAWNFGANYYIIKPNTIDAVSTLLKKVVAMDREMLKARPPHEEFVIL